jgi:hypothetical protein
VPVVGHYFGPFLQFRSILVYLILFYINVHILSCSKSSPAVQEGLLPGFTSRMHILQKKKMTVVGARESGQTLRVERMSPLAARIGQYFLNPRLHYSFF